MGQNFIGCDRDQVLLLPPDLREWLPAGHLARFVIDVVDQLDLSAVTGYYRQDGRGRPAHDPAMMVVLVLYGYAIGVRSSRQIERRCVEDVAFRVIAANRCPDHATIARFLVRHRGPVSELFFQVLELCQLAGMLSVGTIAVDSTKLAANASLDQNRTYQGLREQAARIVDDAIEIDAREDELFGEKRGDELPEDLADPGTRKARIRDLLERARAEIEPARAQAAEFAAKRAAGKQTGRRPSQEGSKQLRRLENKKFNLTDPDSAVVRHRGMLIQGYNVQTAVTEGQVILASTVSSISGDGGQLTPTVQQAVENLARAGVSTEIERVLADSGYWQTKQIVDMQQAGFDVLVPPLIRAASLDRTNSSVQLMNVRLQTDEGKRLYKRRQQMIEPVFAHWKHIRGITRVLKRGRAAVQAEIDLIATTHNLLKLHTALQSA